MSTFASKPSPPTKRGAPPATSTSPFSSGESRKRKAKQQVAEKKAKKRRLKAQHPAQRAKMLLRQLNKLEEVHGFNWKSWVAGYYRIQFRESSGTRPAPGSACWVGENLTPDTDGYYRLQIPAPIRGAWATDVPMERKVDRWGRIDPIMQVKVAVHVLGLMAAGDITQETPDDFETDHVCGRTSCVRHIRCASRAVQQGRGGCFRENNPDPVCVHVPPCMKNLRSPECPVFTNVGLVTLVRDDAWYRRATFRWGPNAPPTSLGKLQEVMDSEEPGATAGDNVLVPSGRSY